MSILTPKRLNEYFNIIFTIIAAWNQILPGYKYNRSQ